MYNKVGVLIPVTLPSTGHLRFGNIDGSAPFNLFLDIPFPQRLKYENRNFILWNSIQFSFVLQVDVTVTVSFSFICVQM